MANKLHVKKDDTVIVLSGKDKGKQGKVLETAPKEGKVIVEGINVATKHVKPRQVGGKGGIVKTEAPLYASKVNAVCPHCGKATRLAHAVVDGKKSRVCKNASCGKAY
jgi:large subunit ribosomal protein L24